jgi:hypothetical protein
LLADAEAHAAKVSEVEERALLLADIACAWRGQDPVRAALLEGQADHLVRSIADDEEMARTREHVDSIRGGHALVTSVEAEALRDSLADFTTARQEELLAAIDPDATPAQRALPAARSGAYLLWLGRRDDFPVAAGLLTDAVCLARTVADPDLRDPVLAEVITALTRPAVHVHLRDGDRSLLMADNAEHLARSLFSASYQVRALTEIARPLADTERTVRLLSEAEALVAPMEEYWQQVEALSLIVNVLYQRRMEPAWARGLHKRAKQIYRDIQYTGDRRKAQRALSSVRKPPPWWR